MIKNLGTGDHRLYCGDCREVLKELQAESVDMVMTSPPYWALRDYGIKPSIWDGSSDCEHEWGNKILKKGHQHFRDYEWKTGGQPKEKEAAEQQELSQGNFCRKCGAWRGTLGLEPSFDLFVKHLCDIFD